MQFVVYGSDGYDSEALNRRMAAREAHLLLGEQMKARGELLYALATLSDEGVMNGSICVVNFSSRKELDVWLAIEPYVQGKVWQKIEVKNCRVGPAFLK